MPEQATRPTLHPTPRSDWPSLVLKPALALCLAVAFGCSSSDGAGNAGSGGSDHPGVGGQLGSGGATPSGGASGSGGVVASGGSAATGGVTSSGGARGTGGVSGAGGASASGGKSGGGGSSTTGAGGASGTGGGAGGASARDAGPGRDASPGGAVGSGGSGAGGSTSVTTDASAGAVASSGCGKTPTLKNSPTATANQNTLTISGTSRQFLIRWPSNYDNTHPYRLILDFHGAGGKDTDLAPSYFDLFDLSNNSTIFIAPSANGGTWNATTDLAFVDEILKTVEADLCIDTSRVELEGFSQGGAMVAVLACGRPGVFRAAVGHSRGGLTAPTTCQPIPYLGSLGLSDIGGNSQATQTDAFAKWNGCTVENLPTAPTGGHVCTSYKGCPAADPVIWCSFDGPHTASPTDSGQRTSWMPSEVWPFLSQF
jgi:poly(3-hydroxybutyrate) depolymerase